MLKKGLFLIFKDITIELKIKIKIISFYDYLTNSDKYAQNLDKKCSGLNNNFVDKKFIHHKIY